MLIIQRPATSDQRALGQISVTDALNENGLPGRIRERLLEIRRRRGLPAPSRMTPDQLDEWLKILCQYGLIKTPQCQQIAPPSEPEPPVEPEPEPEGESFFMSPVFWIAVALAGIVFLFGKRT